MKKALFISVLLLIVSCQCIFAQTDSESIVAETSKAELIDELPNGTTSEERSARIDNLLIHLQSDPNSKAAVVFYCGKECYYGEFEAHIRGIKLMKLDARKYDSSRFVFIYGGYRSESSVELWVVPSGAGLPLPKSDIKFEDVKFKGKFKYKMIAYDCC
ncbi:MAG: hypothetical protein ACR2J3_05980 [Aridibacter sp.]